MMQNRKTQKRESFKVSVNYFHSKQRYIATFSNITNIAFKNKTDQYKATHDHLTGIHNRHKLNDLLQSHFSPMIETEVQSFAFILFDIDHFKEINDTYGQLTCSFGVSTYRNGDTLTAMINRVDKAMYDSKSSVRNQVTYI